MSLITIHAWKALHTGGTKFYQVIRFVVGGKVSFSIEHNGAKALFQEVGKIATGQIRTNEIGNGVRSGLTKIEDKKKDDYTASQEKQQFELGSGGQLRDWAKTHLSEKARRFVTDTMRTTAFVEAIVDLAPPTPGVWPSPSEPDEPALVKHSEWGSW